MRICWPRPASMLTGRRDRPQLPNYDDGNSRTNTPCWCTVTRDVLKLEQQRLLEVEMQDVKVCHRHSVQHPLSGDSGRGESWGNPDRQPSVEHREGLSSHWNKTGADMLGCGSSTPDCSLYRARYAPFQHSIFNFHRARLAVVRYFVVHKL